MGWCEAVPPSAAGRGDPHDSDGGYLRRDANCHGAAVADASDVTGPEAECFSGIHPHLLTVGEVNDKKMVVSNGDDGG